MQPAMRIPLTIYLLCLSLALPGLPPVAEAAGVDRLPPVSTGFADMVDRVKPTVVHLTVKKTPKGKSGEGAAAKEFFDDKLMEEFFGEQKRQAPDRKAEERALHGRGSGFVISADGYILTNAHVVAQAEQITVFFAGRRALEAEIVGIDPQSDLALLRVGSRNLAVAELGDSTALRAGDWAIAIGAPMERVQTVTAGIISATGRHSLGISDYEDFIQTDAAINPGNSGGPLLNAQGRVIGVNTAFVAQTGGYTGIGFAIPINMAKVVAERLRQDGKVTRGWLGAALKDVDPETANGRDAAGTLVHAVEVDSPARRALRQGDLIVAIDGVPVAAAAEVRNRVALARPGTAVQIRFLRNGQPQTTTVVLGEKP